MNPHPQTSRNESLPAARDISMMALVAVVGVYLLLQLGCQSRTNKQATDPGKAPEQPTNDALVSARDALARQTNLESCRGAIQQLNTHLDRFPDQKADPLTADEQSRLQVRFGLDAEELGELSSPAFTLLDVHHLEECFLLRDAARALRVQGTPLEQARRAFEWTARQIRLVDHGELPASPFYILERGWGTAYERDLVFLALLQQFDMPGCLVSCGQGRFLAGVLDGDNIYLFDSQLGLPLPAGGGGILTLADARKEADLQKRLSVDPKMPYDLSADAFKSALLYPVCSLSTLAPRMHFLEKQLVGDNRVRLAVNAADYLGKLEQAAGKHELKAVNWNSGDPRAPPRLLRGFLPPDEGGNDERRPLSFQAMPGYAAPRSNFQMMLFRRDRLRMSRLPWRGLPVGVREQPANLQLGLRPRELFARAYLGWTQRPRELMLRGRFDEANPLMVAARDQIAQNRLSAQEITALTPELSEWMDQARAAQSELLRAQKAGQGVDAAQSRFEALWKSSTALNKILVSAAAGPADAELVYLLALCKHEQAAQRAARQGNQQAASAWRTARDWWTTFAGMGTHAAQAHARRLHAQALAALGDIERAVSLLETPVPDAPLENAGRLLEARKLKDADARK